MGIHSVAVIPGDGIGKDVVPAGVRILEAAAEIHGGLEFQFAEFPWGCEYYLAHQKMMPDDGLSILESFETIFLGAVGWPGAVPDHVSLWGLLIPIRRSFDQYINMRPAKALAGVPSPLKNPANFDFLVIRENSEGEYSSVGGRMYQGDSEIAIQSNIFSRRGCFRVMEFAFQRARERRRQVTGATKSNGIAFSMPFWDEVFNEVKAGFPDCKGTLNHIDALAAFCVLKPQALDVVVASNLFGDILTDVSSALMGSIGLAPSANINPERKYPSMFEPVHGSAPDIVGKGIANPVGQIWSAKMLLDHLGYQDVGSHLLSCIESTLASGIKTPDVGGTATTLEVADEILRRFRAAG